MRGTPGYLAPEWLRSVINEKVDVYAFGVVLLEEVLRGRKNLDWSQADEEDVFRRKEQLMDRVDKNNEDMQLHREEVTFSFYMVAEGQGGENVVFQCFDDSHKRWDLVQGRTAFL
uniref:Receptor-like kinase n=1 Tax=Solanum tuberosum TaxID=4113 RepID=M1BGH4_SOLTU